ncbi:MAG: DUF190 domain-containing protein [Ignavibacteriales bacterium]|nr:DUF190 domain-containing protein [Ignavibacteriales bacterium]
MVEINIFLDEDDRFNDIPLYEYILQYLLHHKINGATIFTAMGGYGTKHHLHFPRKFGGSDEGPLMIMFIDNEEKVKNILPHLKEIIKEGLIIKKNVEVI